MSIIVAVIMKNC